MLARSFAALSAALIAVATPAWSGVVINEIDYDQPGTDTAEFIELYNNGPGAANLGNFELRLINGATNPGTAYQTIPLPNTNMDVGQCFVVCASGSGVPNCGLQVLPATNLIQNGSPDAVVLFDVVNAVTEDVVSYEGTTLPNFYEGSGGTAAADDNVSVGVGISRTPDGNDTNDNAVDWSVQPISPGSCTVAGVEGGASGHGVFLAAPVPNPFSSRTQFRFGLPATERVSLRVLDLRGRMVRVLVDGVLGAGQYSESWDGRDARGYPVPPGVYFARLTHPRGAVVERVLRVR